MPASAVRFVVTDVDGVLTDGTLIYGGDRDEWKAFHVKDGLGAVLLRQAGIEVGFLTSRTSAVVSRRASELGVSFCVQGARDKRRSLEELLAKVGVAESQLCYIGDDLLDLPCLELAGFPVAVADAHPCVRTVAEYVTCAPGGRGAFRETAELILEAQGLWKSVLERLR